MHSHPVVTDLMGVPLMSATAVGSTSHLLNAFAKVNVPGSCQLRKFAMWCYMKLSRD